MALGGGRHELPVKAGVRRAIDRAAGDTVVVRPQECLGCGRGGRLRDSGAMEQRLSLVTLGVADLARSRAFYEALGWHGQEVEQTVFFQAGGIAVSLWSRESLADDCGVRDGGAAGFGGIVLAHNVRSADEVDRILATAEAAGARVTRPPRTTVYGGYAGHFADPDGHAWEIAHNPGFALGPDGAVTVPDFGAA